MKLNKVVKILSYSLIAVIFTAFISVFSIINYYVAENENINFNVKTNKIHFLNTGPSDCIILESDGKYGMVDCSVGSMNINEEYEDMSEIVYNYLNKITNNNINLEFAIGTHAHVDHISGFIDLMDKPNVTIKNFYIRKPDPTKVSVHTIYYNKIVEMAEALNINLIREVEDVSFNFGEFEISILNGETIIDDVPVNENDNSLGVLIKGYRFKAFLAGDINNYSGDEDRLKNQIGKVDLLKVGHHGYKGSTSENFVSTLQPKIAVITNKVINNQTIKNRLTKYCGKNLFVTGKTNGVVIEVDTILKAYTNTCAE